MSQLPTAWEAALQRRQQLLSDESCLRLLHTEDTDLRLDRFGDVCWGYWYYPQDPSPSLHLQLDALCQCVAPTRWHLHGMSDRGKDPHQRRHWCSAHAPAHWIASEAPLQLALYADRGQSPGLFLDQRRNRRWVRDHSAGRRIANLFAYTGAFGIAAAAGGATEVEQVDVSRRYLKWAEENARLNGVSDSITHAAVDSRLFLRGCHKRGRRFDGIICDPPSFARGRRRGEPSFRIIDDLPDLVRSALDVLSEDGWLLVTSNHEGWSHDQMEASLNQLRPVHIDPITQSGQDYEPDGDEPLLKGFLLRR